MTSPTHQELAERYRGMTSEELLETAMDYDRLTGTAQAALRDEFALRKLDPPEIPGPTEMPGPFLDESDTLVIVGRYRDLPQAQIARSALESAGIPCFLRDENTVRNDWLLANLIGGMRLMVRAADREASETILSEAVPDSLEPQE